MGGFTPFQKSAHPFQADILMFGKVSGRYLPPDVAQTRLRQEEFEPKYRELPGREGDRLGREGRRPSGAIRPPGRNRPRRGEKPRASGRYDARGDTRQRNSRRGRGGNPRKKSRGGERSRSNDRRRMGNGRSKRTRCSNRKKSQRPTTSQTR